MAKKAVYPDEKIEKTFTRVKKVRMVIVLLLCFLLLCLVSIGTASTELPDSIYISQKVTGSSGTCTLAAATMMMRARAYLSGYSDWNSITEDSTRGSAWKEGAGLWNTFTYSFSGNTINITSTAVNGISKSSLKDLLNHHPEGIVLYFNPGSRHAVFVTDYEGDTFYCSDPYPGFSSRRTLGQTCKNCTQDTALSKTIRYWYVSSYSIENNVYRGTEMTSGYERVLPDGDYIIAAAADPHYFLDICGGGAASAGTNVQLYYTNNLDNITDFDTWTITYNQDSRFYTIKQKGSNISLDVCDGSTLREKNVQAWTSNGSKAQNWAISRNGKKGYQVQAACSGYALDYYNGSLSSGSNVRQYSCNTSDAQSWVFIPYKPSQPVSEGRYVLLYEPTPYYELDVAGDTGDIGNNTNVQLWSDSAPSQYNSFDLIRLTNGYYKIRHAASGKCLDLTSWLSNYGANVALFDDLNNPPQQWAIVEDKAGYCLISRCNGYALELLNGVTEDGNNVGIYPRLGTDKQRWLFVPAEHTVDYVMNGGADPVPSQTKYYNTNLVLWDTIPVCEGFTFLGWTPDKNAQEAEYHPGDIYTEEDDLTLYPVWQSAEHKIMYYAGAAVQNVPEPQTFSGSTTISSVIPTLEGYTFKCWETPWGYENGHFYGGEKYYPGNVYSGNEDLSLQAVWEGNTYTLYFDPNGGSCDTASMSIVNGSMMYPNLPVASRKGYRMAGWLMEDGNPLYVLQDTNVRITEDKYLHAKWIELNKLVLPDNLTKIEDEAFYRSSVEYVEIPPTVKSVGSKAFADCMRLLNVIIYKNTTDIARDAFDQHFIDYHNKLTIYCEENSAAHLLAEEKGIQFVLIPSSGE